MIRNWRDAGYDQEAGEWGKKWRKKKKYRRADKLGSLALEGLFLLN